MAGGHFRPTKNGIELFVRLTPGVTRDQIGAVELGANGREYLNARVRAVPDRGRANDALERLVAEWLGVPRSTVRVDAGAKQRLKTLRVDGDPATLATKAKQVAGH